MTLAEFPKFTVTSMRKYAPDEQGCIHFELEGKFDRPIKKSAPTWFWLLVGEKDCLCVQWKSEDESLGAVLSGDRKDVPDFTGATLYYLDPYWQAFHVWMVLDPEWGWRRTQFKAMDAVAESYTSADVSIVSGKEVKTWAKLERADKKGHSSRHYPVTEGAASETQPRVVVGGWDHEHCELCNAHIDVGDFGYCDPDQRWMCEACYDKYVTAHDLSFVVE